MSQEIISVATSFGAARWQNTGWAGIKSLDPCQTEKLPRWPVRPLPASADQQWPTQLLGIKQAGRCNCDKLASAGSNSVLTSKEHRAGFISSRSPNPIQPQCRNSTERTDEYMCPIIWNSREPGSQSFAVIVKHTSLLSQSQNTTSSDRSSSKTETQRAFRRSSMKPAHKTTTQRRREWEQNK